VKLQVLNNSSAYKTVMMLVVLAFAATAVLFTLYAMLPTAGADPIDEVRSEEIKRIDLPATSSADDRKTNSHTQVIDTAFGPTVVR
jgi:hypothetical protein